MSASVLTALLDELDGECIQLWIDAGELRCRAPAGSLTAERHARIREHRAAITELVLARSGQRSAPPGLEGAAAWPATGAQQSIALHTALTIHWVTHWPTAVDLGACQFALDTLLQRHEILRTRYAQDATGTLWSVIERVCTLPIELIDLSALPAEAREIEGRRLARELTEKPFPLAACPRLRVALLRLSATEHVSVFAICHSICDAWSWRILSNEIVSLYFARARGSSTTLPDPGPAFALHARAQNALPETKEGHSHLLYWRRTLERTGVSTSLPVDRASPVDDSQALPPTTGSIGVQTWKILRAAAQREQITVFSSVMTVVGMLLCRWRGQHDVLVWCMHSGRRPEFSASIGMFADSGLLPMDFSGDPSFVQAHRRVQEAIKEAAMHYEVTPMMLRPLLLRAAKGGPFAATIINFQPVLPHFQPSTSQAPRTGATAEAIRALDWVPEPGRFPTQSPFGLYMSLTESAETLQWSFRHQAALFEDATLQRLSERLAACFAAIALDPEIRFSALPASGIPAVHAVGS